MFMEKNKQQDAQSLKALCTRIKKEKKKRKKERHTFNGWRSKVLKATTTMCMSFGLANSAVTWWKGKAH